MHFIVKLSRIKMNSKNFNYLVYIKDIKQFNAAVILISYSFKVFINSVGRAFLLQLSFQNGIHKHSGSSWDPLLHIYQYCDWQKMSG